MMFYVSNIYLVMNIGIGMEAQACILIFSHQVLENHWSGSRQTSQQLISQGEANIPFLHTPLASTGSDILWRKTKAIAANAG